MENITIQQIRTNPTNNKHLKTYKEERNQELSNTAEVSNNHYQGSISSVGKRAEIYIYTLFILTIVECPFRQVLIDGLG